MTETLDEILSLGWRKQSLGKRDVLQTRLSTLNANILAQSRWLDEISAMVETMALDDEAAIMLRDYHEVRTSYAQAQKAKRLIERELERRQS